MHGNGQLANTTVLYVEGAIKEMESKGMMDMERLDRSDLHSEVV